MGKFSLFEPLLMNDQSLPRSFFSNNFFSNGPRGHEFNNPFDTVREIHRSINDFINQSTRAFFSDLDFFQRPFEITRSGGRNSDVVSFQRDRLQWYDSNLRRPEVASRPPPAPKRAMNVLDQLPITTICITKKKAPAIVSENNNGDATLAAPQDTSSILASDRVEYIQKLDRTHECLAHHLIPLQQLVVSRSGQKPECEICLLEYVSGDHMRHLPCGHAFHQKCIDRWLSGAETCPKCRKLVVVNLRRLHNRHNAAARKRAVTVTPLDNSSSNNSLPVEKSGIFKREIAQTRSSILRSQVSDRRKHDEAKKANPALPRRRSKRCSCYQKLDTSPLPESLPPNCKSILNETTFSQPTEREMSLLQPIKKEMSVPSSLRREITFPQPMADREISVHSMNFAKRVPLSKNLNIQQDTCLNNLSQNGAKLSSNPSQGRPPVFERYMQLGDSQSQEARLKAVEAAMSRLQTNDFKEISL